MPSIVLCSFGTYNLNSFTAQYPTRYGNSYQLTHKFADLLSDSAANYSYFNDHEDMQGQDVFGATDLITFTRGDLPYDTIEGSVNFTSPQLIGLVRSAAIIKPNPVEKYNDLNHTRWCVMWVPYRVTLDHPPEGTANPATDTGRESDRQLDSGQTFKVGINLAGVAILQDLAWQYVFRDPVRDEDDNLQNIVNFPHVLYVKFVDFSGSRKQEWLADSACSQYLRNILYKGDPDGFQIVELNQWHELSLQKKVTAKLTGMQKLGWPWPGWPWLDESRQEVHWPLA